MQIFGRGGVTESIKILQHALQFQIFYKSYLANGFDWILNLQPLVRIDQINIPLPYSLSL